MTTIYQKDRLIYIFVIIPASNESKDLIILNNMFNIQLNTMLKNIVENTRISIKTQKIFNKF